MYHHSLLFLFLLICSVQLMAEHVRQGASWQSAGLLRDDDEVFQDLLPPSLSFSSTPALPPHSIIHQQDLQAHGTTTLAFLHEDSVIICIDSKASMGPYVSSRNVKKIFPLGDNTVATMAGGAADCSYWIRTIARQTKILEEKYATPFNVAAKARLLSSTLKKYRGKGMNIFLLPRFSSCYHLNFS